MEIGLSLRTEEVRKKLARVSESPHWCRRQTVIKHTDVHRKRGSAPPHPSRTSSMTPNLLGSKSPFIMLCWREAASYPISHPIGPVMGDLLCGNLIIDGFLI